MRIKRARELILPKATAANRGRPKFEDPHTRALFYAEKRMNFFIDDMRKLRNLGNRKLYYLTKEDLAKIDRKMREEMAKTSAELARHIRDREEEQERDRNRFSFAS